MNIVNKDSEWVISGHSGSLPQSKAGIDGFRAALSLISEAPVGLIPQQKPCRGYF